MFLPGRRAELRFAGADDPAFSALKAQYADVLGEAPPVIPPNRSSSGLATMPVKHLSRLSACELAVVRAQLISLLDRGWIQHFTAGHTAAVVFARKPDESWRICYD